MSSTLPPQAHVIAGQLEDKIRQWRDRDPAHYHPGTRAAGEEATRLCGSMIVVFSQLRDDLTVEIGAYESTRLDG